MTRLTRPVANNGDEQDAFTGWRRVLIWKAGQRHRIKRRANKRDRAQAKTRIRNGQED